MRVQDAKIYCNRLILDFEVDRKSENRDLLVIRRRSIGGYEETQTEYAVNQVECRDKKYTAHMEIDLAEQDWNGLYWDILLKFGSRSKDEFLVLDEQLKSVLQENAKKTEYWLDDDNSLRLYPTKDGRMFIKKVIDGVTFQSFDEKKPSVREYVSKQASKPSGSRYIDVKKKSESEMVFSFENFDITPDEAHLVLVSDRDGSKQVLEVSVSDVEFTVNLSNVKYNKEENYRIYMAVRTGGFYYYFRIKAHREKLQNEDPSVIYYDADRYKGCYSIGTASCILYTGATNDGLNLMFADNKFCENKMMGEPRLLTEKKNLDFPFKFSMVIAVYNAAAHLSETIESVINQDIGFKRNIQLVLVDDGSTDNSLEICNYYAERYKGNIVVRHKENGGVSSTRNLGLTLAEGCFVNFMDSDDLLSENTCSAVWDFFNSNYDKIDVVSIPINQFGAIEGPHWQNYKFNRGTRIIDLNKEFGVTCMNSAASFIKNNVAKLFRFDESMDHAEDLKYMLQIVPIKMRIGVVTECEYKYRRYPTGVVSLVSGGKYKKNFYSHSLDVLVYETIDKYMNTIGYIPSFVQNTLMVDMQWKLNMPELIEGVLTEEEEAEYLDKLKNVFNYIDDNIILTQKKLSYEHKYNVFKLKYGDVQKSIEYKDIKYYVGNTLVGYASASRDYVEFVDIKDGKFILEGYTTVVDTNENDEIENYITVGGILHKCKKTNIKIESKNIFGKLMECISYIVELPVDELLLGKEIYLYTSINGHVVARRNHIFSKFAPFNKFIDYQYTVIGEYIIRKIKSGFVVEQYDENRVLELEAEYIEELEEYRENKLEAGDEADAAAIAEAITTRAEYHKIKSEKKKELWLVSDRPDMAGDNGEAFMMFLSKKKPQDVDYYFVIDDNAEDYAAMSKLGKIIPFGSRELMLKTLVSDKIISSQADEYIINPFGELFNFVRDLRHYKFIFLQHGITKDDLSGWLNRYNKNISLFVTAAKGEYESIAHGEGYYYTEGQVQLTGFPRFDRLVTGKKPKKEIIFMPTWRKALASEVNPVTGKRVYIEGFKNSDYYKFYQGLISDNRVLDALKKNGYKAKFVVHPSNKENACDFVGNDYVKICYDGIVYREEFNDNALLITDYSSVVFDFAYLKKPVIYTQSDREEFYETHSYDEGYWDYERDGFGPVCKSYDETVEEIVKALNNGCIIEAKYEERINKFYDSFDSNNCQRVYEAIRRLK